MCGRFTLFSDGAELARLFGCGYDVPLAPRYNIAPNQPMPAVRHAEGDGLPLRQLVLLQWGLIPSWASDANIAYKCINARSETAADIYCCAATLHGNGDRIFDRARRRLVSCIAPALAVPGQQQCR